MSSGQYIRAKVVVIGDYGVGKTTLVKSFMGGEPISDITYKPTIGMDVYKKEMTYEISPTRRIVFLWDIWDISGQVGFQKICYVYLKGAKCGIVVFDVSRKKTLESVPKWIDYFVKYAGKYPIIIVGNKIDLREKGEIECLPPESGEKLAREIASKIGIEIPYIETSALHNINVENVFRDLARNVIQHYKEEQSG